MDPPRAQTSGVRGSGDQRRQLRVAGMRRCTVFASLAAVAALTGVTACGSDSDTAGETSTTAPAAASTTTSHTAATTASVATTTTALVATTSQYGSIVAQYDTDLLTALDESQPCIFRDVDCDVPAALSTYRLSIQAKTLVLALEGAAKPGVPAYIGAPPAELQHLYDETITNAREVGDAAEQVAQCGAYPDPCDDKATGSLLLFAGQLESTLKGWRPYTG
jgi:hypothetical protein